MRTRFTFIPGDGIERAAVSFLLKKGANACLFEGRPNRAFSRAKPAKCARVCPLMSRWTLLGVEGDGAVFRTMLQIGRAAWKTCCVRAFAPPHY